MLQRYLDLLHVAAGEPDCREDAVDGVEVEVVDIAVEGEDAEEERDWLDMEKVDVAETGTSI